MSAGPGYHGAGSMANSYANQTSRVVSMVDGSPVVAVQSQPEGGSHSAAAAAADDDARARSLLQCIAAQLLEPPCDPPSLSHTTTTDSTAGTFEAASDAARSERGCPNGSNDAGPVEPEAPALQITFYNTDIGRKYRHEIEKFLHSLMTAENLAKREEPLPRIQPRANLSAEPGGSLTSTTVVGQIQVYRWFIVDRQGWPMIANMLNQTPGIDIPQYTQQYESGAYPPPDDVQIVEAKPIKTSKTCFNCGGHDHEVKSCPKPFDRRTFQKNKAKFQASGRQYGRYHKDENTGRIKPGRMSQALREALGLRDDQLPRHVYRMRTLGYPPGWLLEAEATNSGLAMFDRHGREVDLDGDLMEDGQVAEHRLRDEDNLRYNAEKLIAYPGFNTPCPEGVVDEALRSGQFPKLDPNHDLQAMSSSINVVTADSKEQASRKRPIYEVDDGEGAKRWKSHHQDMDVSDGEADTQESGDRSPVPEFTVIDELSPEQDGEQTDSQSQQSLNETLNALEEEKRKLLAELNEIEGDITVDDDDPSNANAGDLTTPVKPQIIVETKVDESPSYQSMSHQVVTPVIQHTAYNKLPPSEKFSDGITEHLPYENLPNATGVYERMSGVMKTVKEKMSELKQKRKANK